MLRFHDVHTKLLKAYWFNSLYTGFRSFSRVLLSCKQKVRVWEVLLDLLLQYGCSLLEFFGGLPTALRPAKAPLLRGPVAGSTLIWLIIGVVLPKEKSDAWRALSLFIWKKLDTKALIGGVKLASSFSFFFSIPKISSSCPSKEPTTSSAAPKQTDTMIMTADF